MKVIGLSCLVVFFVGRYCDALSCDHDQEIKSGKKCIWKSDQMKSWYDAYTTCTKMGGKLLQLEDGNDYVDAVNALTLHSRISFWVRANMFSGQWRWGSSTEYESIPVAFWALSFLNGEPVHGPPNDSLHACGFLDGTRFHFLEGGDCGEHKFFLCESNVEGYFENPDYLDKSVISIEPEPESTFYNCEEKWHLFGKNCYMLMTPSETALTAKLVCNIHDAVRATPNNQVNNAFIKELGAADDEHIWIDLVFTEEEGFSWANGKTFDYQNWVGGIAPSQYSDEKCASLSVEDGTWIETDCFTHNRFVCEKYGTIYPQ